MNKTTSPSPGRLPYVAPGIEVIEVAYEGVIAGSGTTGGTTIPGYGNGGELGQSISSYGASTQEFDDLINDILTFEE